MANSVFNKMLSGAEEMCESGIKMMHAVMDACDNMRLLDEEELKEKGITLKDVKTIMTLAKAAEICHLKAMEAAEEVEDNVSDFADFMAIVETAIDMVDLVKESLDALNVREAFGGCSEEKEDEDSEGFELPLDKIKLVGIDNIDDMPEPVKRILAGTLKKMGEDGVDVGKVIVHKAGSISDLFNSITRDIKEAADGGDKCERCEQREVCENRTENTDR